MATLAVVDVAHDCATGVFRRRVTRVQGAVALAAGWFWLGLTGLGLMLLLIDRTRRVAQLAQQQVPTLPPPQHPLPWIWMTPWAVVYPTATGERYWVYADELGPGQYVQLRRHLLLQLHKS